MNWNKYNQDKLLDNITILYDTREQDLHIVEDLKEHSVPVAEKKLDCGDYSFGTIVDGKKHSFDNEIVVERKNGLDELSNNLTRKREQFTNEMERGKGITKYLMIENDSFKNIADGMYRSGMDSNSFIGSLMSFQHRYDLRTVFISKDIAWLYIYKLFYYHLREKIKEENNGN